MGTKAAVAALLFNAFAWGVSWWPFRYLHAAGLHPLWATAFIYALALVLISLRDARAWGELLRTPALWLLVLAAGTTNASFNWAMALGDVVRVILLFYLMPVWAVLLARLLLGERFTAQGALRIVLALAGAAIVLWPEGGDGLPVPRTLAEGLAVLGGFAFALNNVMLRREARRSPSARALAMFAGGAVVAAALALGTAAPVPPTLLAPWLPGLLALALVFVASNLALQYGASRLPANTTAVIMISEVLFAAVSALLLGASEGGWPLAAGGTLIVAASLLALRAARPSDTIVAPPQEAVMAEQTIYDFEALSIEGKPAQLASQRGKVILVVNTASACGFTPQFGGLEQLWQDYRDKGLMIVGFPSNEFGSQDPGSNDEIAGFCVRNYGVSFPMMAKVEVNGAQAHPLWRWLKNQKPGLLGSEAIKWNFTKFLVGKDGQVLKRYAPNDKPESLRGDIEAALAA